MEIEINANLIIGVIAGGAVLYLGGGIVLAVVIGALFVVVPEFLGHILREP